MWFYLVIVGMLVIFSVVRLGKLRERNLLALAMLFFYLLATLRSVDIGNDTSTYFDYYSSIFQLLGVSYMERGYFWLNWLIRGFTDNFNVFLAVINLIIYYALYKFIRRYSSNYGLSLLLFLCLGFWGNTVNIMRQELAVAMFLYAYMLYDNAKRIRSVFAGMLAPWFQKTSLIYFLFFIIPKRINGKFYAIAGSAGVIITLFIDRVLFVVRDSVPRFEMYLTENSVYVLGRVEPAVVIYCAFLLFVWALALYIYSRNKGGIGADEPNIQVELQINMVFTAFVIMLTATRFSLMDRCAMFFHFFVVILIPNLISMIKKDEYRHLVQVGFTVAAIGYFVIVCIFRPGWNHIYPYRFYFQSLE